VGKASSSYMHFGEGKKSFIVSFILLEDWSFLIHQMFPWGYSERAQIFTKPAALMCDVSRAISSFRMKSIRFSGRPGRILAGLVVLLSLFVD